MREATYAKYDLGTMETIDRAEEWRRLKELYLQKTDEELEEVAADGYELTDVARQALEGEIARRGLKIELQKAPRPATEPSGDSLPDFEQIELVRLVQVWDRLEAKNTIDALNSSGLPAFIGPDNVGRVEDFKGSFDRGVDIKVRYVDNQRALQVLSWASPAEGGRSDSDDDVQFARCPKCQSEEILFLSLDGDAPDERNAKFNWRCDACGYEWKDDGLEAER